MNKGNTSEKYQLEKPTVMHTKFEKMMYWFLNGKWPHYVRFIWYMPSDFHWQNYGRNVRYHTKSEIYRVTSVSYFWFQPWKRAFISSGDAEKCCAIQIAVDWNQFVIQIDANRNSFVSMRWTIQLRILLGKRFPFRQRSRLCNKHCRYSCSNAVRRRAPLLNLMCGRYWLP